VGLGIRWDMPLYPPSTEGDFPFLYLPPAALFLAVLSYFGPVGMVVVLCLINCLAWGLAGWLSASLINVKNVWAWLIPMLLWWPYFHDSVLLGQPNLLLLVLSLSGLMLLKKGGLWKLLGGLLIACAIVTKAFPVVILCYTIYRRYWTGTLLTVLCSLGLLALPGFVRGHDRNLTELGQWMNGMLRHDESGFSQRGGHNLGWKNHSLWALGQRYLRPVNSESETDHEVPPLYVNFANFSYSTTMKLLMGVAGLIGLWFIWVMPAQARRTPDTDAAELALLCALVTIASPACYSYYLVWLVPGVMFLVNQIFEANSKPVRLITAASLGLALLLLLLAVQWTEGPHYAQAYGCCFWGVIVLCAALGWHLRLGARSV
jgi:hypothetical protein